MASASGLPQKETDPALHAEMLAHARVPPGVRPDVAASWMRSVTFGVSPLLARVPTVLDHRELVERTVHQPWIRIGARLALQERSQWANSNHVVAFFDVAGTMLHAEGDARIQRLLDGINFRLGSVWSENEAGTNGPGTVLATGLPAHIVGADHFCEAWHPWHCAAAPVHCPETHALLGAIDISGQVSANHPGIFLLARSLARHIEEILRGEMLERHAALLSAMATRMMRWPSDSLAVVNRCGRVLLTSHSAPFGLVVGSDASAWNRREELDVLPVEDHGQLIGHILVERASSRDSEVPPASGVVSAAKVLDAESDRLLLAVVERCNSMRDAAATLGIARSTLYRRLQRLGVLRKKVIEKKRA